MISRTNRRFRQVLRKLPPDIRKEARKADRIFRADPSHPSLHFKPIHASKPIYSVRITINYRAIGVKEGECHDLVLDRLTC